jgi:outer membrane receptor protein involved in Fe transport
MRLPSRQRARLVQWMCRCGSDEFDASYRLTRSSAACATGSCRIFERAARRSSTRKLESLDGMWQGEAPLTWVLRLAVVAAVAVSTASTAEERLPEVVVTAPPIRTTTPSARDPTAFSTIIETREAPTSVETLTDVLLEHGRRAGPAIRRPRRLQHGVGPRVLAGQVQVYLDGVPLSRADNEVVNLSDLPLDAVDHVEVYRGTTPLIFSQSGPAGVVNVVTRRPGTTPLAAAAGSYGSFETRKGSLAARRELRRVGRLRVRAVSRQQGRLSRTRTPARPSTRRRRRPPTPHQQRVRPGRAHGTPRLPRGDAADARAHDRLVRQIAGHSRPGNDPVADGPSRHAPADRAPEPCR